MKNINVEQLKTLEELKARYRTKEQVLDDALSNIAKSLINHQFAHQLHGGSKTISFNVNDIALAYQPYMDKLLDKLKDFGLKMKYNKSNKEYYQDLI